MDIDKLTVGYLMEFLSELPADAKVTIHFGKDNPCRKLVMGDLGPNEAFITLANLMDELTLQPPRGAQ